MGMTHDEFGPEYIIQTYDSKLGIAGFLVIDNTVLGPGKGGIRMTPTVNVEEVTRLARTMTWKNALAGIPFGGAKAGINWSGSDIAKKQQAVASFAKALKPFMPDRYIAGPDVNSGEQEMKWFVEAAGTRNAATGKPADIGGLPHELGSTGFGVAESTKVALKILGIQLENATVAIEGFGNVGSFAFKFLHDAGVKIVAVADSRGAAYRKEGLDYEIIARLRENKQSVKEYPGAEPMLHDDVFALSVDVLIPATVTDVINEKNKSTIKAKMIVEGANIPMRESIEDELFKRGIFIVPDFVANAGGVISSYAEYRGFDANKMFALVKDKVSASTETVIKVSIQQNKNPRMVAVELAKTKVRTAMIK